MTGRESTGPPHERAEFARLTGVSRETLERLERYETLLRRWNAAINLVAPSTLPHVWRRHFLDSAQLAPLIPAGSRVLVDLGSGAGFPGLVLAIMARGIKTHLIESNHRRVTFLREVSRETGTAAIVHAARIEAVEGLKADVVTARALAPLPRLIELARPFCDPETTCLFLKGQHIESELTGPTKSTMMRAELLESLADPAGRIVRLRGVARA